MALLSFSKLAICNCNLDICSRAQLVFPSLSTRSTSWSQRTPSSSRVLCTRQRQFRIRGQQALEACCAARQTVEVPRDVYVNAYCHGRLLQILLARVRPREDNCEVHLQRVERPVRDSHDGIFLIGGDSSSPDKSCVMMS